MMTGNTNVKGHNFKRRTLSLELQLIEQWYTELVQYRTFAIPSISICLLTARSFISVPNICQVVG
jgi:hypothetical protein